MKVTKTALLESINTALESNDQACKEWAGAVEAWRIQERDKWLANKGPQWKALRDLLTKKLNKGQPITESDVSGVLVRRDRYRSSYFSDHTFTPNQNPSGAIVVGGKKYSQPATAHIADLRALKLFLEGSPDESFSLESLSRLGFKAPAFVFRAAVS